MLYYALACGLELIIVNVLVGGLRGLQIHIVAFIGVVVRITRLFRAKEGHVARKNFVDALELGYLGREEVRIRHVSTLIGH